MRWRGGNGVAGAIEPSIPAIQPAWSDQAICSRFDDGYEKLYRLQPESIRMPREVE